MDTSRCSVRCFCILTDGLCFFRIVLRECQVFDLQIGFRVSKDKSIFKNLHTSNHFISALMHQIAFIDLANFRQLACWDFTIDQICFFVKTPLNLSDDLCCDVEIEYIILFPSLSCRLEASLYGQQIQLSFYDKDFFHFDAFISLLFG